MGERKEKIGLIGNPNTGKTSLFNRLTGLRQKVGNYPGITVDKKSGEFQLDEYKADILDLPGTYSIHAASKDEEVVLDQLLNRNRNDKPDKIIVVVDGTQLKRNLFLFHQIIDLKIPVLLVINMADQLTKKQIEIDMKQLSSIYGVDSVLISTKTGTGLEELKQKLVAPFKISTYPQFTIPDRYKECVDELKESMLWSEYACWLVLAQNNIPQSVKESETVQAAVLMRPEKPNRMRIAESIERYKHITKVVGEVLDQKENTRSKVQKTMDAIFLHPVFGIGSFLLLLLIMFQAVFSWSAYPMDLIDLGFTNLSSYLSDILPNGVVNSMITDGIIPGLGGVVIFLPQIIILFTFLTLLEESGYMSRVVFLMDKLMSKVGLNGKSIVPLMSGIACAIPAVMAARNIENPKQRLITILVTPFMTCSARIPVYTVLIGVIIPAQKIAGFIDIQALVLLGLYLLGTFTALLASVILNHWVKTTHKSTFILELPTYKMPSVRNSIQTIFEKSKSFVWDAGKIIVAVSILLWALASFGIKDEFKQAEVLVEQQIAEGKLSLEEKDYHISALQLEHSFLGSLGKTIEPVIKPLGYDWKIGIALISSIAAREVFVGTLATIYSVGNDDELSIKERLLREINPTTGKPVYSFAVGISLLLFYAFAMQCISTVAIVKRETNSWRWASIQFFSMTLFAYFVALLSYQLIQ